MLDFFPALEYALCKTVLTCAMLPTQSKKS